MADLLTSTKLKRGDSQWIFVLPADSVVHDGRRLRKVTRAQLATYTRNTELLYAEYRRLAPAGVTPFRLPLVVDHDLGGASLGTLEEFKLTKRGPRDGIWARVDYSPSGRSKVKRKEYRFVSIRIADQIITQQGKAFGPVIAEVSLTNYPRYQSLGEISDTAGMALSGLITGKNMKNLLALITALLATEGLSDEFKAELEQAAAALAGEGGDEGEGEGDGEGGDEGGDGEDALAASIVAKLEGVIDQKIAPLSTEIARLSKLNLSSRSRNTAPAPADKEVPLEQTEAYKSARERGLGHAKARLEAAFKSKA